MEKKKILNRVLMILEAMSFEILPDQMNTEFKNLGMDSMEFVDLTMQIEQLFRIDISNEEAAQIDTVNKLVEFIGEKKAIAV